MTQSDISQPDQAPPPQFYTAREAARLVGSTPMTICRMAARGEIPGASRIGSSGKSATWLIPTRALQYIKSHLRPEGWQPGRPRPPVKPAIEPEDQELLAEYKQVGRVVLGDIADKAYYRRGWFALPYREPKKRGTPQHRRKVLFKKFRRAAVEKIVAQMKEASHDKENAGVDTTNSVVESAEPGV